MSGEMDVGVTDRQIDSVSFSDTVWTRVAKQLLSPVKQKKIYYFRW